MNREATQYTLVPAMANAIGTLSGPTGRAGNSNWSPKMSANPRSQSARMTVRNVSPTRIKNVLSSVDLSNTWCPPWPVCSSCPSECA